MRVFSAPLSLKCVLHGLRLLLFYKFLKRANVKEGVFRYERIQIFCHNLIAAFRKACKVYGHNGVVNALPDKQPAVAVVSGEVNAHAFVAVWYKVNP